VLPRIQPLPLWVIKEVPELLADRDYRQHPMKAVTDTPQQRPLTRPAMQSERGGLMDEAKSRGWTVISMKTDWKRIFAFE
jgi:hypothetical protein